MAKINELTLTISLVERKTISVLTLVATADGRPVESATVQVEGDDLMGRFGKVVGLVAQRALKRLLT